MIEILENRCDDLHSCVDKLTSELENEKRQRITRLTETNEYSKIRTANGDDTTNCKEYLDHCANCTKIAVQLQEQKTANAKETKISDELREQVSLLIQVFSCLIFPLVDGRGVTRC